jgi:hypothetical protein
MRFLALCYEYTDTNTHPSNTTLFCTTTNLYTEHKQTQLFESRLLSKSCVCLCSVKMKKVTVHASDVPNVTLLSKNYML